MKILLVSPQACQIEPIIRPAAGQEQMQIIYDTNELKQQAMDLVSDPEVLLLIADLCAASPRGSSLIEDFLQRRPDVLRIGWTSSLDAGTCGLINRGVVHGCWTPATETDEILATLRRAVAHRERSLSDARWITCLEQRVSHQIRHADRAFDDMIAALVMALDIRENESAFHSRRVALKCLYFAIQAGVETDRLEDIYLGALLHDVGKIGIPDAVLLKRGGLTAEEREVMQTHVPIGVKLLCEVGRFRSALDIPRCHHERFDGRGYPRRLRGEDIPLAARLFAIVDVYDALRSERPYKPPKDHAACIEILREARGTHFDATLLDIFCAMDAAVLDDLARSAGSIRVFQQAMLACRRAGSLTQDRSKVRVSTI